MSVNQQQDPLPQTNLDSSSNDPYSPSQDQVLKILNTPNHAPFYISLSILGFLFAKQILRQVAPNEARCQGPTTVWKWVNTANSLVHSAVTGVGAVICVYLYPRVAENVISTYSDYSHKLVCFSVGYFIFDFMDMAVNHRKRSSYELMAHHIFVLSCFILSVTTRYYLAFTIISLVVEVNSIFLHWRQLLVITKTPKCTTTYRSVSLMNLLTFVIFRIVTLGWMTRWLALNRRLVNAAPYAVGCVSIFVLMSMSTVLFFRLLKSDFHYYRGCSSSSSHSNSSSKGTSGDNSNYKCCCNDNNNSVMVGGGGKGKNNNKKRE